MWVRRPAPIPSRPLEPVDLPEPVPAAGELRVRVRACAVCRTDLHVIEGELPTRRMPIIPGHQVVGRVEAIGPACERFRPGDRVGIAWLRGTCGACGFCRSGRENLCEASVYTGYDEHGGYAELTVAPEAFAYPIPPVFSDLDAAPLLCAGIIGYRALARSELPPGGRLGLYGFGSSAHVVLQLARHRGCQVLVVTRGERHRALARHLGAHWVGGPDDPMPMPLDAAIVFAPAGEIVPIALRAVRRGGTVALAGICMTAVPPMDYAACLFHEKTLTSVEANTRADGEALLSEAAAIPIRPRVTAFALAEANDALIRLKQGHIDGTGVLAL
ncbi:MAG: zinc-dependent alcohol dehydrogenase family protein [Candidatus Rokuibacteriota bacterium]